jgi:hypothetical protein
MSPRLRQFLVAVALLLALAPRVVLADEKSECLAAASKGQTLRDAHSLVEAREQFKVCSRSSCPPIVQTDCGAWLEAVEQTLPTVVLSAKDGDGRDLVDVTVTADGQPLVRKLDGQALPMNPGLHSFRFELADGTSSTSQALVKEGVKAQGVAVVVRLPVPEVQPQEARSATLPPPEPPKPVHGRGGAQRAIGWLVGGAGLVAVGVGSGIAFDAKSKDGTAAREGGLAGQTTSHNAVNEGNAATVVFVTGVVVTAAGFALWITAPSARIAVGVNGSEVLLGGAF